MSKVTLVPDVLDKDFNPLVHVHRLMSHEEMQVLNNATRPGAWTIKSVPKPGSETGEIIVLDNYELLKSALAKLQQTWHQGHIALVENCYAYVLDPIVDHPGENLPPVTKAKRGDRVFVVKVFDNGTAEFRNHHDKVDELPYLVVSSYLGTRRRHRLLSYIRETLCVHTDVDQQGNLNFNDYLAGLELKMKASTQVTEVKIDG